RTARSPASPAELNRQLATVRQHGYAVARGELEPGLDAVAAPIRGAGGEVIAALSVSGHDVRLADQLEDIGHLLVTETAILSGLLGHQSGTEGAA
ncbi:MAG: IclR family transcriptional regulator, partial [Actinomycetota bacterium]|nr:IclR family transcriptional regulator [Actinomycetota bacterium]